ncbi:MAG: hypothetical protein HW406_507 [Candidatus Brocadiaceae bacterium]|nr:hypothetical protein [Candidatus Brocadiaceae bacterium]
MGSSLYRLSENCFADQKPYYVLIYNYNLINMSYTLKIVIIMARPLRIEFDRALYHVTSRGNARETIFITDTNRVLFFDKNESALIARIKTLYCDHVKKQKTRKSGKIEVTAQESCI